jgi:6-pyruvoyltetrahydropterin/6-carboxytetrahydropterin synthase
MPFAITTCMRFRASHQLRLYDGALEPLHEHEWQVKVTVAAAGLDAIGVVMDFHELSRLTQEAAAPMRQRRLNDLPPFASGDPADNPSAENVARHIGMALAAALPAAVKLTAVEVWETPENSALYQP